MEDELDITIPDLDPVGHERRGKELRDWLVRMSRSRLVRRIGAAVLLLGLATIMMLIINVRLLVGLLDRGAMARARKH